MKNAFIYTDDMEVINVSQCVHFSIFLCPPGVLFFCLLDASCESPFEKYMREMLL
jgi:hypothetical protein